MVEKVLKIFFTVCKSELLGIVYSSHRIEENASAGAENGYNAAILGKKVQNSSSATTKSERMLVKMDIIELPCTKKSKTPSKNGYLYTKPVQTPSKAVTY